MRTVAVHSEWLSRLDRASMEWRADAREHFRSTLLSLLLSQREAEEPEIGVKHADGMRCVPVPSAMLSSIFSGDARAKFVKVCERHRLVVRDGSWIARPLASSIGRDAHCDRWHITEPECGGPAVEVPHCVSKGLARRCRDWLLKADGMRWVCPDVVEVFRSKWAADAYDSGGMTWTDWHSLAVVAKSVLDKGFEDSSHLYREYTPLASCGGDYRGRCFVREGDGTGMSEFIDLNGCITFCAPLGLGMAEVGGDCAISDSGLVRYFDRMANGVHSDVYEDVWRNLGAIEPLYDLYRTAGDYGQARSPLKKDCNCCCNVSLRTLGEYRAAWADPKTPFWDIRRRRWLVWCAMYLSDATRQCWQVSARCKANGARDGFFRAYTGPEKCLFGLIGDLLAKEGIATHRLHDSVWSSDPRWAGVQEPLRRRYVGSLVRGWVDGLKASDPGIGLSIATGGSRLVRTLASRLSETELDGMRTALELDSRRTGVYMGLSRQVEEDVRTMRDRIRDARKGKAK